ncbi:MAG TPA: AmmeMemoRadiSam system protein A, partial [Thermopetrobacter sp.]|nr:AmmeMemoRadiSam system protein A [Thermopetrobacter sp.]
MVSMETWKSILPRIARLAIADAFGAGELDARTVHELLERHPELGENRASFVTLHRHGALRGCIGSILPVRPLIEDVIHNARAAAFEDPRFPPLTAEELPEVDIEVSLLTLPRPLPYDDVADLAAKVRPGVDG